MWGEGPQTDMLGASLGEASRWEGGWLGPFLKMEGPGGADQRF